MLEVAMQKRHCHDTGESTQGSRNQPQIFQWEEAVKNEYDPDDCDEDTYPQEIPFDGMYVSRVNQAVHWFNSTFFVVALQYLPEKSSLAGVGSMDPRSHDF